MSYSMIFIKKNLISTIFFLLLISSVLYTVYTYIYVENYSVKVKTFCDPLLNKCFVLENYTYKRVYINASLIDKCNNNDTCLEDTCKENPGKCSFEYCDNSILPEGEECFYNDN